MSGGAWNYQEHHLEDLAADASRAITLLSRIEHELDWGISGDTCYDCAKKRVLVSLEAYFGSLIGDESFEGAIAILRNYEENRCDQHATENPK